MTYLHHHPNWDPEAPDLFDDAPLIDPDEDWLEYVEPCDAEALVAVDEAGRRRVDG